jgi:iron complex transport system ATP-binding protein
VTAHVRFAGTRVVLSGHVAIDGVDLDVPAGAMLAIVGPNGSGKSTLLRTLYRSLRPDGGVVAVAGDDVWSLAPMAAARRTAAVVQEPAAPFEQTAWEVAALGRLPHLRGHRPLSAADRGVIAASLHRTDASGLADRSVTTLSGGEKQRVLIARALAQQPHVLALDEPTNHLDIAAQFALLDLLGTLDATVLLALHDLPLAARWSDAVVVLDAGRVVATGPPDQALTPALIEGVFGVRAVHARASDGRLILTLSPLPGRRPSIKECT